jgi:hypothetical protein
MIGLTENWMVEVDVSFGEVGNGFELCVRRG